MLYILLAITIIILIVGAFKYNDACVILGTIFTTAFMVALLWSLAVYNNTASTAESRLTVLQEQNEMVLTQITPVIEQYVQYESGTLKELKLTPEKVIAMGTIYPELKADDFYKAQINIIVSNQKEIKDIKMDLASLNAYHLWLWTPIR